MPTATGHASCYASTAGELHAEAELPVNDSDEKSAGRPLIEAVAAGIAHEVRNPLNALQINVRILEEELRDLVPDANAHVYSVLAKIGSELTSLDNFVSEFLRFARPPRLKLEAVHVRPLLSDLAMFIGPECAKKGVTLAVAVDSGPVVVSADNFQLKHAVLNLVLNALQSTPAGGKVRLSTGGDREHLTISVVDSGEGIPEDVLARVFDVFFTMREGGTGLGLPIARRIVEEHGGTLALASKLGEGTTATITLPARAAA
jgi:signal transduction histidine kinase